MSNEPLLGTSVKVLVTNTVEWIINESRNIPSTHQTFSAALKNVDFFSKFREFRLSLKKQIKFTNNVLRIIENLLHFLRATKQQLCEQHHANLYSLKSVTSEYVEFLVSIKKSKL